MKTLTKNNKYRQGIFNCTNKQKYKGSHPIIWRSSLELKAMRWMDSNPNVLSWGSESVVIPYKGPDGKLHRYFVDLVCEMKRKDGNLQKLLIEIKPQSQTLPPTISPRKSAKTMMYENYSYAVNQAKWTAAKEWAKKKSMLFVIFTEKDLNS